MTEFVALLNQMDWLTLEQRQDPLVAEFLACAAQAKAEEKESSPRDWTAEQHRAMDEGDWRRFSRLRGYTEAEIENFARFIQLVRILDDRYGEDFSCILDFDAFGPSDDS